MHQRHQAARAMGSWPSQATKPPRRSSIIWRFASLSEQVASPIVATFSIVAHDPQNGDLGIAVASKFLAVGSVVPWAQAGAGAVATQALANIGFGPRGMALMAAGRPAAEALDALLANDPQREHRQVGLVDARGNAAAHTGTECMDWAGHFVGP